MPEDVLLVEDNMIIALDTEDTMLKLGVKTCGAPAASPKRFKM